MSNFLTLVQQLQREVGVSGVAIPTVVGQTDIRAKLVSWIADADVFIQSLHWDWNFLWSAYAQDTTAGSAAPPVPSDLNVWDRDSFYLDVSTATSRKITTVDYLYWRDRLRPGVKANRKPSQVVIKPDNSIHLIYPADATYNLTADYWATPTKMTVNTDVSAIPEALRRIIVVQAMLWYAIEEEVPSLFAAADKELNGDKNKRETGLLARLESLQLPHQEGRMMGQAPELTCRPV